MSEDRPRRPPAVVDLVAFVRTRRGRPKARRLGQHSFDLDAFLAQLQKIRQTGPFEQILGLIPGLSVEMKNQYLGVQDLQFTRVEAIVESMTPWERQHPDRLDGSRRRRIVRGSGTSMGLVRKLLFQFNEMRRMMNGPHGPGPGVA